MSLPTDVFPLIVAQVDTDDCNTLLSLCLSNRLLGWEAIKRLYRELGDSPTRTSLHCKLLSTLISRPDLAAMVRSYALRYGSRAPRHTEEELYRLMAYARLDDFFDLQQELLSILASKALPLMVNLKELYYNDRTQGPEAGALLASTSFQLKKLDWRNRWDDTLLDFLKRQKQLKWIELNPWDLRACIDAHPIPRFPCQNLTSLTGKQAVVEAILPFAPGVRNLLLHWSNRPRIFTPIPDVARDMAKCMGQLTRLKLHNCFANISVAALEGAVDNLEYLAVECLVPDDEAQVPTFVSRLKKLKMFILLSHEGASVEKSHALAVDLLRESESLEQVVMKFRYYDPPTEYGVRSQSGSFLLSRRSNEMRWLDWGESDVNRFMLPICEEDATSPGWTDVGPFVLLPRMI